MNVVRTARASALMTLVALASIGCSPEPSLSPTAHSERALQYVQGTDYPHLVLEIDSAPGLEPTSIMESSLATDLEAILDKQTVSLVLDETLPNGDSTHRWTTGELHDLARETENLEVPADTIKIHIMVLNGTYANGGGADSLGVAWDHRHIAIFAGEIDRVCNDEWSPFATPLLMDYVCAVGTFAVWSHEIGHVIGLVGNGIPMVSPHVDATHAFHDTNPMCVMNYEIREPNLFDLFIAGTSVGIGPLGLGEECLDDLEFARTGMLTPTDPPDWTSFPSWGSGFDGGAPFSLDD